MRLVLFVEGDDDVRFMERVIVPRLGSTYEMVKIQRYASRTQKETCRLVKAFTGEGWAYLFVHDKDQSPCNTQRKESVSAKWEAVAVTDVIVVDQEIEAWYVSGADSLATVDIGFTVPRRVETMTKERLATFVGKRYTTPTDIKLKLLENFSLDRAREKCISLDYFCRRLGL